MEAKGESIKLTPGQQRVLKLLFKFRFVSSSVVSNSYGHSSTRGLLVSAANNVY